MPIDLEKARLESEIRTSVRECDRILKGGSLARPGISDQQCDEFRTLMICMRDLLAKLKIAGHPITWDNHVVKTPKKGRTEAVENISNLVKFFRDAMAHPDADNYQYMPNVRLGLGYEEHIPGGGRMYVIQGQSPPSCDFSDDHQYTIGGQRIYYRRHILRVWYDIQKELLSLGLVKDIGVPAMTDADYDYYC